jgi:hypothetical protein
MNQKDMDDAINKMLKEENANSPRDLGREKYEAKQRVWVEGLDERIDQWTRLKESEEEKEEALSGLRRLFHF